MVKYIKSVELRKKYRQVDFSLRRLIAQTQISLDNSFG